MNDWYNANEHRCYPFKETTSTTLPRKEIVDCKFFLKNANNNKVRLYSRQELDNNNTIRYIFKTNTGNITLDVPKTPEYKLIKFEESFGYGFVIFGDNT